MRRNRGENTYRTAAERDEALVIKLRGSVLVEDIESRISVLQQVESKIEGDLNEAIVNASAKKEIEKMKNKLCRIGGQIDTLINIVEGHNIYKDRDLVYRGL
jgi:hypothetical protein